MVNAKNTGERLVAIETKLEEMSSSINEIKDTLKSHIEWEDRKYESIKKEFAAKWVERGFYAVILILIGIAFEVMLRGN